MGNGRRKRQGCPCVVRMRTCARLSGSGGDRATVGRNLPLHAVRIAPHPGSSRLAETLPWLPLRAGPLALADDWRRRTGTQHVGMNSVMRSRGHRGKTPAVPTGAALRRWTCGADRLAGANVRERRSAAVDMGSVDGCIGSVR